MSTGNVMQTIDTDTLFDIYLAIHMAGQIEERAKIVAWLRNQDGHGYDDMRANLIEAGEHLK